MAPESAKEAGRRSSLIIANATRAAGIVLGLHTGFQQSPDPRVIALAAFMLAGAQFSETALLMLMERFFGLPPKKKEDAE